NRSASSAAGSPTSIATGITSLLPCSGWSSPTIGTRTAATPEPQGHCHQLDRYSPLQLAFARAYGYSLQLLDARMQACAASSLCPVLAVLPIRSPAAFPPPD